MKRLCIVMIICCFLSIQAKSDDCVKKYEPKAIEFMTLMGGDFEISLEVSRIDFPAIKTIKVKASELQGLNFAQVIELFRDRINAAFEVQP